MEKRRTTRGRPKRVEEVVAPAPANPTSAPNKRNSVATTAQAATVNTRSSPARKASPARRASPGRTRTSPVRRSSRPRSTVLGSSASAASTTITPPSPIKEVKEIKSSPKTRTNLPTTLTTNTSSRAPQKSNTTSSVHSSSQYSTTTQKTIEIRSSTATVDSEVAKLTDYIRRSVSKTFSQAGDREGTHTPATTTEASRYSRSVSGSVYNDNYFKPEFSDNEDNQPEEEHYKSFNVTSTSSASVVCRKLEPPREYGGWIGVTALMLFVPSVVYYLQWSCTKSGCSLKTPNLGAIWNQKYLAKVFQGQAITAYLTFVMGMFLLSAAMIGRRVRLPNDMGYQYKFNALPIAILLTLAGGVAEYLKYPVADFVLKHYLRFCIYSLLNAFIAAIWAYCRSNFVKDPSVQVNVYGKSGSVLVDFALGRQINPKWFGFVEFKQIFYRISLLTTLLFAECFIYKSFQLPETPTWIAEGQTFEGVVNLAKDYYLNVKYEPAALFAGVLLFCYIGDAILFEHHLASSFELQGEGFGALLLLRYAASPFLYSAVAKYFFDRQVGIHCTCAVYVVAALLLVGLIVKRISSAIKYKYRIDPNNPLFSGIETIHTFQGRRLLLGAFWGRIRQPNYAGDILALSALAVQLFMQFSWPPLICILLCIALLLHRAVRVNARNSSRYHSSWVRYCSKVRNYIVPRVF